MRRRKLRVAQPLVPDWQSADGTVTLYCGDCLTAIPRLRAGFGPIDLVLSDPPFGVRYTGGTKAREALAGDDGPELYVEAARRLRDCCSDRAASYYFAAGMQLDTILRDLRQFMVVRNLLVWNKDRAQYGNLSAQYKQKHEMIIYAYYKGCVPAWYGGTSEVTVWDCGRSRRNDIHPTQKPVELLARAIENSSAPGDLVIDPFMGGGSTGVACIATGRRFIGIELNATYFERAVRQIGLAFSERSQLLFSPRRRRPRAERLFG